MRSMLKFGLLGLLLVSCNKGKDGGKDGKDGDDDDDDDSTTPTALTADTAIQLGKVPAEVRFWAYLAWNSQTQQVMSPIIDGDDGFISAYIITLYEAGWSSADELSFCQIAIDLEGYTASTAALTEGFTFGIDIPEGDKVGAFTDCISKGFDPNYFLKGDPLMDWGQLDWQLRLGGPPMSQDLIDWLTPDTTTGDFDITQYMPGAWSTETGGFNVDDDDNYWYAYAMDANGNVDFDRRLFDIEMAAVGQLATAYFVFDQRVFWNLE